MRFMDTARALEPQLVAWRRDFHAHPEIGFTETRTAGIVAETLRAMGITVETSVGKTGVVGHLGSGSPAVGIRADMDALPIQEINQVDYASQNPGLMHACGHDAHTAILLGVARMLSESPNRPPGEVRFLFQPCEEGSVCRDSEGFSGAGRMVQDCALDGLDAVIALHVASEGPVGIVAIDDGVIAAASDTFTATIVGKGGHGAYPHQTVDPIFMLGQVINLIQGIRSRRVNPMEPAVITIASVRAGDAANAIPAEVKLGGTIRSFSEEIRNQLHAELENALAVTRSMGGDYRLTIVRGAPPLVNAPSVASVIREVAQEAVGKEHTLAVGPSMGAEDFSHMTSAVPGAMFHLGAQLGSDDRPHHSPQFDIDEAALPLGAAILAETTCRLLERIAAGSIVL